MTVYVDNVRIKASVGRYRDQPPLAETEVSNKPAEHLRVQDVPASSVETELRASLSRIVTAYFDEDDSTDAAIKDRDDELDAACDEARELLGGDVGGDR